MPTCLPACLCGMPSSTALQSPCATLYSPWPGMRTPCRRRLVQLRKIEGQLLEIWPPVIALWRLVQAAVGSGEGWKSGGHAAARPYSVQKWKRLVTRFLDVPMLATSLPRVAGSTGWNPAPAAATAADVVAAEGATGAAPAGQQRQWPPRGGRQQQADCRCCHVPPAVLSACRCCEEGRSKGRSSPAPICTAPAGSTAAAAAQASKRRSSGAPGGGGYAPAVGACQHTCRCPAARR